MHQLQTACENIVGKGEIAPNERFLLFPQCFLLNQIIVSAYVHIFDIISLFAAKLQEPKIGLLGKGLNSPFINADQQMVDFQVQDSHIHVFAFPSPVDSVVSISDS